MRHKQKTQHLAPSTESFRVIILLASFLGAKCSVLMSPVQATSFPTGWSQIPNTAYHPVCPTYPDIMGTSDCAAVAGAWGSAWADTTRNRMVLFGGGHTDYFGNEVYVLDLNANPITMTLAKDATHGSNLTAPSACGESNKDNTPNSRHDNDGMAYLSSQDLYFIHGGNLANCGSESVNSWILDPNSLTWTQNPQSPNFPGIASTRTLDYDPVTKKIYEVETNGNAFWQWDPATRTWTVLNNNIGGVCDTHGYEHTSVIDPVRRLLICAGVGDSASINLNAPYTVKTLSMKNCGSIAADNGPGLAYDSALGQIIAWSGGATVYLYNPDTDSCTPMTPGGTPPGAQQGSGTYKRLSYFPSLDAFILINDASQNAYVLRLNGGAPPPPPPPPPPPTGGGNDADFQSRCSASGVLVCEGFDTAAKFVNQSGTTNGFYYDTSCPTWPAPCIQRDTGIFLSGGSSARWDIYGNTGPDAEGYWFQNFGQTFAQNSTFYVQFAFRPDTTWTTTDWPTTGPSGNGTAPKLIITHGVDGNGQPVTCGPEQWVISNENGYSLPTGYTNCGSPTLLSDSSDHTQNDAGPEYQSGYTAEATGAQCNYNHGSKPTGPNCFFFAPNTWYTIYVKTHVGTWGSPNSSVEAWMGPYGSPLKKFINITAGLTFNSEAGVAGFSALTLTQFMTGKMASVAHPTAHVWYDELIVSSQPIAQPGSTPPPSPSACDVNADGNTNVADVQVEVNMALGLSTCTNPSGACTVVSVQRVVNAALGGSCVSP